MKGQVLQHLREHLKVPSWKSEDRDPTTKELHKLLSRLNEMSGCSLKSAVLLVVTQPVGWPPFVVTAVMRDESSSLLGSRFNRCSIAACATFLLTPSITASQPVGWPPFVVTAVMRDESSSLLGSRFNRCSIAACATFLLTPSITACSISWRIVAFIEPGPYFANRVSAMFNNS